MVYCVILIQGTMVVTYKQGFDSRRAAEEKVEELKNQSRRFMAGQRFESDDIWDYIDPYNTVRYHVDWMRI